MSSMNSDHVFRSGSAWEKWYNAGRQFIENGGVAESVEPAAQEYFAASGFSGENAKGAIKRAFSAGAQKAGAGS